GEAARGHAADVPGTNQQPVARHLGVRRILAQRAQEQRRHPGDHGSTPCQEAAARVMTRPRSAPTGYAGRSPNAGRMIRSSVTITVTRSAGVTSKAKLSVA